MITTLFVHCIVSQYIAGNSINIGQEFKGFKSFTTENIAFCMFETFIPCGKLFIILLLSILLN